MEPILPEELRYIHDIMIERYGGLRGEKDPGMVEYACEKPFSVIYGQDVYPTLYKKAAAYMITIAKGHFFMDGNKRTAIMTTYSFLMKNGHELVVTNKELYDMCILVATDKVTEDNVAQWLEENSKPL